jgi:hypothetical protein
MTDDPARRRYTHSSDGQKATHRIWPSVRVDAMPAGERAHELAARR